MNNPVQLEPIDREILETCDDPSFEYAYLLRFLRAVIMAPSTPDPQEEPE